MAPHVDDPLLGEKKAPTDQPHLAVFTSLNPPKLLAIPPGATLALVPNAENPQDGMVPFLLTKVTRQGMEVRCACGREGCTRWANVKFVWKGSHPHAR